MRDLPLTGPIPLARLMPRLKSRRHNAFPASSKRRAKPKQGT